MSKCSKLVRSHIKCEEFPCNLEDAKTFRRKYPQLKDTVKPHVSAGNQNVVGKFLYMYNFHLFHYF